MSLLIKALANAEKDKQAELNKRQDAKHTINTKMPLELTPVDEVKSEPLPQATKEDVAESANPSSTPNSLDANELTLEDEAGLSSLLVAGRQQTKPKANVNSAKESKVKSSADSRDTKVTSAITPTTHSSSLSAPNQKAAAKAFVANQLTKPSSSKLTLAVLGVAGTLMIWLGLQGYQYIADLAKPEVAVIRPEPTVAHVQETQIEASAETPVTAESIATENSAVVEVSDNQVVNVSPSMENEPELKPRSNVVIAEEHESKKMLPKKSLNSTQQVTSVDEVKLDQAQSLPQNAAQRMPLKLVSKTPAAGVDPTLLAAYQAFVRGEDDSAQQQYRQVLQRNVRNVDALLGMAAIAQRQGRNADAVGWYEKVLEVEPRNTIAQSAVATLQANTDVVGTESRIKNMLAQQPEAANLHAALGNIYATQNQWALAQQAYFNASRFAPNNADYAFNLAISLDQLGKSSLALVQYQRALDLLNHYGASSPDRAQLEARIQALRQ